MKYIIGIDEVGRGALAGPVCIGIFCCRDIYVDDIIKNSPFIITDSKQVTEKRRIAISQYLSKCKKDGKCIFLIMSMDADKVDTYGISVCIKKMIEKGVEQLITDLSVKCNQLDKTQLEFLVMLDGGLYAPSKYNQETIIKGDEKEFVIAAASIIAKVHRDTYMKNKSTEYPQYGFEKHVGYGTSLHQNAIKKLGVTVLHRKTFCRNVVTEIKLDV